MKSLLFSVCLLVLFSCSEAQDKAAANKKANTATGKKAASTKGDLKTGVYHAYQLSGGGFGYQYKFELLGNGQYKMFDKQGNYTYDPTSNVIKFTSGGIKEFNGVFTRVDHVNSSRKLMIVLDFQGGIPDTLNLGSKPGGYYQYAYYQE